jgi:hypothetical protein
MSASFVSAGPNPAAVPAANKSTANWEDPSWAALKFGLDTPTYYRYTAAASGIWATSSFTARAEGDLDGDGTTSLFQRTGSINPATGDVVGGSGIYKVNEID